MFTFRNAYFYRQIGAWSKRKGVQAYRHDGDLFGFEGMHFFIPVSKNVAPDTRFRAWGVLADGIRYDFAKARVATLRENPFTLKDLELGEAFKVPEEGIATLVAMKRLRQASDYPLRANEEAAAKIEAAGIVLPPVLSVSVVGNSDGDINDILMVRGEDGAWAHVEASTDLHSDRHSERKQGNCVFSLKYYSADRIGYPDRLKYNMAGKSVTKAMDAAIEDYYLRDVFMGMLLRGSHSTVGFENSASVARSQKKYRLAAVALCNGGAGAIMERGGQRPSFAYREPVFVPWDVKRGKDGSMEIVIHPKRAERVGVDDFNNIVEIETFKEVALVEAPLREKLVAVGENPYRPVVCKIADGPR